MNNLFVQSILAGLVSGFLVVVSEQGLLLFNLLAFFAAVPIVYISLAAGLRFGVIASAIGLGVIMTFSGLPPEIGIRYLLGLYLPFLALSFCAFLSTPILSGGNSIQKYRNEWHPASEIVVWSVVLSLLATLFLLLSFGSTPAEILKQLDPQFVKVLELQQKVFGIRLSESEITAAKAQLFYTYVQGMGFAFFVHLIANFSIGYKLKEKSGLGDPSWRSLQTLDYPESLFFLYLGTFGLATLTSGMIQLAAFAFLGILSTAYFLYGLLIIHTASRYLSARKAILIFTYSVLVIFNSLAVFVIVAIGIAEPVFKLRQRAQDSAERREPDDE